MFRFWWKERQSRPHPSVFSVSLSPAVPGWERNKEYTYCQNKSLCVVVAIVNKRPPITYYHLLTITTHKTSGFKTSGFKTSNFKRSETSGFQYVRFNKTSGLQNFRFTKSQVFKTSGCKKTSIYILYLWLVEIRWFCCSHVCRQSDGCVLFFILEVFLP